jgi:hypothetical protein
MVKSGFGPICDASGCPSVRARIVFPAIKKNLAVTILSTPDDHFVAGPDCRMRFSGLERRAGSCPTVAIGIVSPASVSVEKEVRSASPYDHFSAGPDRCVKRSPCGRIDDAGGCPAVVAGIISPAGVQRLVIGAAVISAPDDHLATSPHRRVRRSGIGRIGGAGCCPTVGAGIVSPASV